MDDRYLFKGKRIDNGKWVFGSYIQYNIENHVIVEIFDELKENTFKGYPHKIYNDSVGQCTGLSATKSYRGSEPKDLLIFEGDIVRANGMLDCYIVFAKGMFTACLDDSVGDEPLGCLMGYYGEFEIIGNIHEKEKDVKS